MLVLIVKFMLIIVYSPLSHFLHFWLCCCAIHGLFPVSSSTFICSIAFYRFDSSIFIHSSFISLTSFPISDIRFQAWKPSNFISYFKKPSFSFQQPSSLIFIFAFAHTNLKFMLISIISVFLSMKVLNGLVSLFLFLIVED